MFKEIHLVVIAWLSVFTTHAQSSGIASPKYGFSQTTFGLALEGTYSGSTSYINNSGEKQIVSFHPQLYPRLTLGGTHFWGKSEFYFSLPVFKLLSNVSDGLRYDLTQNDIVGARYYLRRLQHNKLSPFIGLTLTHTDYRQVNAATGMKGPLSYYFSAPLHAGLSFTTGRSIWEIGARYNYRHQFSYYISPAEQSGVNIPAFAFSVGYKRVQDFTSRKGHSHFDTAFSLSLKAPEDGSNYSSAFFSVGMNTAFFTGNTENPDAPWLGKFGVSPAFAEVGAGYYSHYFKSHLSAFYRQFHTKMEAYGFSKKFTRQSVLVELHRYLFDYHGFVPFIGMNGTFEHWHLTRTGNGTAGQFSKKLVSPGVVLGWDILPEASRYLVVRTNIRYFPLLEWQLPDETLPLQQIEFNVIQLAFYPDRFMNRKRVVAL